MSRIVSLCGGALPANIMPANSGNPTGYWEPQEVSDFNDRVLSSLDMHWRDVFAPKRRGNRPPPLDKFKKEAVDILERNYGDEDFIVLKDPRISLLVEFWTDVLLSCGYQPSFVVMVRDPVEIAESLVTRDATPRNQSLIMWASYMLAVERGTRGRPRVFVNFQDLLADPEAALDRIELALNLSLPRRTWQSAAEVEEFLVPEVKARVGKRRTKLGGSLSIVDSFYGYLHSAALDKPDNEDVPNETAEWLLGLEHLVAPILTGLSRSLDRAERRVVDLETAARLDAEGAEHAKARLSELETSLAEGASRADDLRAELNAANAEVARLTAALAEVQAQERETSEQLAHRLEAANAHAGGLQAELDTLSAELASAGRAHAEDHERWRQLFNEQSGQLQAAQERVNALEADVIEERELVAGTRAELEAQTRETAERLRQLEDSAAQIDQLENAVSAGRASLEDAQHEARGAAERLRAVVQERDEAAARSGAEIAQLADEARLAKAQSVESAAQISRLARELSERQRSLATAESAHRELADRSATMQVRLDALEFEIAETSRRNEVASATHQQEIGEYRQQLAFAKERIETSRLRAESLQAALDASQPASPSAAGPGPNLVGARPPRSSTRRSPLAQLRRLGARDAVRRGDAARERHAWREATIAYAEALGRDPTMAHIWVQYGHMLKEAGDWSRSEVAYRKAIDLVPDDYDVFLNLGHLLKISGRLQEARSAYETSLHLEPSHAGVAAELAEVNRRLGVGGVGA